VRLHTPAEEVYADPKILATNLLWLLVGLVVAARWFHRLSARAGAWAAVVLLVLAIVNLAVVDAVSTFH
jgi:hypothetical protein